VQKCGVGSEMQRMRGGGGGKGGEDRKCKIPGSNTCWQCSNTTCSTYLRHCAACGLWKYFAIFYVHVRIKDFMIMQNGNGLSDPGLDATECASRGTEEACPECRLLVCSEEMATHRYITKIVLIFCQNLAFVLMIDALNFSTF
jgi:hypothetical protein